MINIRGRISFFKNLLFAPKLRYVPEKGNYQPHRLETWGSRMKLLTYLFLGKKRFLAFIIGSSMIDPNFRFVPNCLMGLTALTSLAYLLVGLGRAMNPVYMEFYHFFERAPRENKETVKNAFNSYGLDFKYFPVDFEAKRSPRISAESEARLADSFVCLIFNFISQPLSYVLARYFAIYLIYPGVPCSYLFVSDLHAGRQSLIKGNGGKRFKLRTLRGNKIDAIFIDNRNKGSNGKELVVVCEGNCGFYERGCLATALEGGYSVLGWNHPGFGGSEGLPFPHQERDAIEAVMEFATDPSGASFDTKNILIYGWSIGGFTSSWAAASYPSIKGLILDATFDNILPLAEDRMPIFLKPLVRLIIRKQMNLDVYAHVQKYPGPILFVRRTEDELICTGDVNLMSNRGTFLVRLFLKQRFPCLLDKERLGLLNEWLAANKIKQRTLMDQYHVDRHVCTSKIDSILRENDGIIPADFGQGLSGDEKDKFLLFLASKYLVDHDSNHCVILPPTILTEISFLR